LRAVNKNAVKELVKYQAKAALFCFSSELVNEYLTAFRGVRRIQPFGSFMGAVEPESVAEVQARQLSFWKCECGACKPSDWRVIRNVHRIETDVGPDGEVVLKPEADERFLQRTSCAEREYQRSAQQRISFAGVIPAERAQFPSLPEF
jgi:hypothetical protein